MELVSDFKAYLSSIEPPAEEVSAREGPRIWRCAKIVRTDPESKEAHKETFLSGSYARSTAIKRHQRRGRDLHPGHRPIQYPG